MTTMNMNRLAIATALLSGFGTFTAPVAGQNQKKAPVIVGLVIDGDRILVEFDGDEMKATVDGEKLDAKRIEKRGNLVILMDSESNPIAHIRNLPTGGSIHRVARSNKAAIGIELNRLSKGLADHLELNPKSVIYVTRAIEGRAAARAGMRDHDVIIEIDGESPVSEKILSDILGTKKPGDMMKVRVLRRGKEKDLTIKCERAKARTTPFGLFYNGLGFQGMGDAFSKPYAPYLYSAIDSLDLLKQNMSKGNTYKKYQKQFESAREYLRKAQQNVTKNSTDYFRGFNFSNYANSKTLLPVQLFRKEKQGKKDVLLLDPLTNKLKSGSASPRLKSKKTTDLGRKMQRLEQRFERVEKMLEKLLNKKKN